MKRPNTKMELCPGCKTHYRDVISLFNIRLRLVEKPKGFINNPMIPCLMSLVIPNLGIWLIYPRQYKALALLGTLLFLSLDATALLAGVLLFYPYLIIPMIHVLNAYLTYTEWVKLKDGKFRVRII